MKVLILGAGWYGCHAAMTLKKYKIDFNIFDISHDFFTGSSSKNQNRLHLGFHYPRSFSTRQECIYSFKKFMKIYGEFTMSINKNYYCIDNKSLIDFETYISIYDKDSFKMIEKMDVDFKYDKTKLQNVICVGERFIDFRKASLFFKKQLSKYMIHFYNIHNYTHIIDCTYSAIKKHMFYENCISFIYEYKGNDPFALTIMDGKFFSLYPYDLDNKLYTLTDVEYTPNGDTDIRKKIEEKVKGYILDFDEWFEYKSYFISRKAKINNINTDSRSLQWSQKQNYYYFSGGKIGGCFVMEKVLKKILGLNVSEKCNSFQNHVDLN